ncbi:hypothetical protein P4601_18490 [Peribacillus frigoritolerans]|uniref:hypothetical protein n=1 Tax=Peribacillus frigoritolerans TaxID=450367 RepID=UPI002E244997|nr:hypothetical protein [Peribacillus frigoritolerans]
MEDYNSLVQLNRCFTSLSGADQQLLFLCNYRGRIVKECCLIFIQQLGQIVEEL